MQSGAFSEIPIVDLGPLRQGPDARAKLADELREICHEVGFFIATNHGVDPKLVDSVFDAMRSFYALPTDQKQLIDKMASRHFRGWESLGSEYTNNRPDMREQIDLWSEWPARDREVTPNYLRLLGPNQWLPNDVIPGFRALLDEYFARLGELGDSLLRVFSLSLGLDEDHLTGYFGDEPMSLIKLINYPPTPAGQAGVNAHHDAGFVTLLAAGHTPGLQVGNSNGEWINVPTVEDAFVVNLGEMLQGISGNYFVATPHRVITTEPRMSVGYFHGPSLTTALDPLPISPQLTAAVAASERHANAGFMASSSETDAGVGDMSSAYRASTYGEQLWNYFSRSYPKNMEAHYPT